MLQNVGKSNHLASSGIKSVPYNLVVRVVSGSDVLQCSVVFRLFHMKFQQVETVVNREVVPDILHIQRVKASLRLFQGDFYFAGLQHLVGMIRRKTKRHATVNNIFSQSQSQIDRSFFRFFIA